MYKLTQSPIFNLQAAICEYNDYMQRYLQKLGLWTPFLLGIGLFVVGLLALDHLTNNLWLFDLERLDLVRATSLDRADAASLLEAAYTEIIVVFLAAVLLTITGLVLPLAAYLNKRFNLTLDRSSDAGTPVRFLVVLRQSMWVGFWVAFCIWLQMNRALGVAVALLVATVLVLFEILLQVRTRATAVKE